jgi:hypothetical protein
VIRTRWNCRRALLAAGACLGLLAAGCPAPNQGGPGGPNGPPAAGKGAFSGAHPIKLPNVESRPGTAVALLIDTSGSMAQSVPDHDGKMRPKYRIAAEALGRIVDQTARWKQSHADSNLQLGIFNFSSSVSTVLPMGPFDKDRARAALGRIPPPNGGTAIGQALEDGTRALFQTGCTRKCILCVTDGENTAGPNPAWIARQLHDQTGGAVNLNFVAFDTRASQFAFVQEVNGHVVEAGDARQLQQQLSSTLEKHILAEAPDEPAK